MQTSTSLSFSSPDLSSLIQTNQSTFVFSSTSNTSQTGIHKSDNPIEKKK